MLRIQTRFLIPCLDGNNEYLTVQVFAMNLSAPFLPTLFKEQMDSVVPYCDYLIGNESEALAYSESHNLKVCYSLNFVSRNK
jgi:sugar/nucleoside kinase (ribokinase family)